MQFAKRVIVKIRTWVRTLKFAVLFIREDGSDKEVKEVRLKSTNEVELMARCFSDIGLTVLDAPESDGSTVFTVRNNVYIQRHTGIAGKMTGVMSMQL